MYFVSYGDADDPRVYQTDADGPEAAAHQCKVFTGEPVLEVWQGERVPMSAPDPLADLIAETARRTNVPVDAVEEFARKVRDLSAGNGAQGLGGGLGLRLNDREVARAYPADGVTVGQVRDHLGRLAHAAGVRFEQANEFVNFITEGDYAEDDDNNYY